MMGLEQTTHGMKCMEIWGGSHEAEAAVSTPGLDIYVLSKPYQGAKRGGDLHYVSLCGGGITTRLIVADLCGHGAALADQARMVRTLVRRNINRKNHARLVEALNRQFTSMPELDQFATAAIATYLAHRRHLTVCLAGHPRPLYYRAARQRWSILRGERDDDSKSNLPLGIDASSNYSQLTVSLDKGDFVLLYTDALIEARNQDELLLGEGGLLELVGGLDLREPALVGSRLLELLAGYRDGTTDDDLTLLTLYGNGNRPPRLSLGEKLDVYAKVFGLRRV
jgi:phosphoserine phosphatase RsbU/P